jgi:endo-1,4-beta-xylanase
MRSPVLLGIVLVALGITASAQTEPSLKDAYKDCFLIGAAINQSQIYGKDAAEDALIKAQFSSITPEDVLKWERVHPQPDTYDFAAPDAYVDFGQKNHMYIVGHTLVWHNQTPKWVFEDEKGKPLSREALLERMREHIRAVVGRYKGRINSWDVVNEALEEDGSLRQSPWLKIIGEDYIAKAFEFAHEADPSAQLNYNEYNLADPAKRAGAVKLIKKLQAEGVPVNAVGLQEHDHLDWPGVEQLDTTITEFGKLGVKVMITELDIDVLPEATPGQGADASMNVEAQAELNPYAQGLPDSVQQALARRYADLFSVFLKHRDVVTRVTFWGVTDADSWLNHWPVKGRTSYPLLFDRHAQPKPAFHAVIATARKELSKRAGPGLYTRPPAGAICPLLSLLPLLH